MKRKILRWWYKNFHRVGDRMLIYHHMYGKFRVRYPDGKTSQPFDYPTAKDYKEMFGGEVIDNF